MSRIIGVRDLHFAVLTKDEVGETPTWETPVRIPSLKGIEISDSTESVTFYSDDVAEEVVSSFGGKEVEITLGKISNEVEATLTGNQYDETTGALTQVADAKAPEVAIMFRAPKSNGKFQYCVLYKGVLTREGSSYATKEDSVEPQDVVLKGVFMPLQSNGKISMKVDTDVSGSSTLVSSWFTSVQLKETKAISRAKSEK